MGARLGMGVAGLLEALAVEAEEVVWPGKARGAAIGIDISVWLHELATWHYCTRASCCASPDTACCRYAQK